ncbi:MAG: hypothetical protein U0841_28665 [Chloroflexia bacterium]
MILFSDGRETIGKARDWAAGAAGRGIVIDALAPDSRRRPNDLRVADLRAPASTWQGDDVEIEAVIAGDTAGDVRVQLRVDGGATGQQTVKLTTATSGASGTARFTLKPLAEGYHALRVEIVNAGNDPITDNNLLNAATVVRQRPSVLIVEDAQQRLLPATRAGAVGIRRDRARPERHPHAHRRPRQLRLDRPGRCAGDDAERRAAAGVAGLCPLARARPRRDRRQQQLRQGGV